MAAEWGPQGGRLRRPADRTRNLSMKSYCQACYPKKIKSHALSYYSELIFIFFNKFSFGKNKGKYISFPAWPAWFSLTHYLHTFMRWIGFVKFIDEPDHKDHLYRSWICLQEGKKRGLKIQAIKVGPRMSEYYRAFIGNRRWYYDGVPCLESNLDIDDKIIVKEKLLAAGLPAAEGKLFWKVNPGVEYGLSLGFPLVVKPGRGTHAYHVTAPVNSEKELIEAIRVAKQYQPRFIVERYLTGNLHRLTVIARQHVFACRREGPNVIGDGVRTIYELIEQKNSDPRRSPPGISYTTLHQIPLNEATERFLAEQGLTLQTVIQAGQKIRLWKKDSIGSGGDIEEMTQVIHPDNIAMALEAADIFGSDLIGFDFICPDLKKSWHEQTCGILEANSLPYIDFHAAPSIGEPQPIAERIWDGILSDSRVLAAAQTYWGSEFFWRFIKWGYRPPLRRLYNLVIGRFFLKHNRQEFLMGRLPKRVQHKLFGNFLRSRGFEDVSLSWIDPGETVNVRRLKDKDKQYHVRVFNDGEIRGHLEYAPESRPVAHLLEEGFEPAREYLTALYNDFLKWGHNNGLFRK